MDAAAIKNFNTKPLFKTLVIAIYFLSLLIIALFAYRRPLYNWDMLAYMALVVQEDHSDTNQIREITYKAAQDNIPAVDYEHLVGVTNRKDLSENSEAFFNKLPFYAVKPMYIKMVSLFYKAGFSLPMATVLPSIIFYLAIGLLFFYWLLKYLKLIWAFSASLSIMFSGFMVFMARLSTPDCLSAFLLLSAFYFIIERPSLKWTFFFLILSEFARLDNILPCVFILSFLFFSRKWQRKINLAWYLLMLVILVSCYFGITIVTMKPFGWNVLYYPTFARYLDLSHTFHFSFSFKAYLALVVSHAITAVVVYNFMFFMFFLVLILYSPSFKYKNLTLEQSFCIMLVLTSLFRFVLYPDLSDRFNVAIYLCLLLVLVKRYAGLITGFKPLSAGAD